MKRLLRILIGSSLVIIPMFLSTWVWLFESCEESWLEGPGLYSWWLASGQWDKLPD